MKLVDARLAVVTAGLLVVMGCGGDEPTEQGAQRGAPSVPGGGGGARPAPDERPPVGAEATEPEAEAGPKRPPPVLTREDFSLLTRDPFQSFLGGQAVEVEPSRPRGQRDVKLAEYNFEDLKLIAIVHSGRGVVPRALFLATDGKSQTVKQGEYFSRAEVLLAAVNRDYVEVEVVDESLASSLNMTEGERRAIYLKKE